MNENPTIYFYHIRKTGGTSINFAFFSASGKDPQLVYNELNKHKSIRCDKYKFVRDVIDELNNGSYFYGFSHIPSHNLNLAQHIIKITCFRDPIKRVLSIYRAMMWKKSVGEPRPGHIWLGSSFSDFLNKLPRTRLCEQLYMFSSTYNVDEALETTSKCKYILFTDNINNGMNKISHDLGIKLKIKHDNKSIYEFEPTDEDFDKLSNMLIDEIKFVDILRSKYAREG
ncbi:MAG: hypothetical protein GF411_13940 [Candidatus Lokiarchaeota archaeon]|nr:hypothetical protein [Candidatus Lokiarchaeota archaeon]